MDTTYLDAEVVDSNHALISSMLVAGYQSIGSALGATFSMSHCMCQNPSSYVHV